MSLQATADAQIVSPTDEAIEALNNRLAETIELVHSLAVRLEPVLRPLTEGNSGGEPVAATRQVCSPVAGLIWSAADRAAGLSQQLSDLFQRLEV